MGILNIIGTFVLICLVVVIPIKWIKYGPVDGTFTIYVKDRETDKYGCLVNLADWALKDKSKLIEYVAHEAEHVKISVFNDVGLITNFDSQEADAYLTGWIAQCIYDTIIKR